MVELPVSNQDIDKLPKRVEARVYQMLLDLRAVWLKQQERIDALEKRLNKLDYKYKRKPKRRCKLWPSHDWRWPWNSE